MAAQERHSAQPDAQDIGEALGTRPATVRDVAYGEGQLFSAGHGAARLEVFPQSGVTRLTAQDMRVELFGNAISAVSDSGVEFHRTQPDQQASLTVVPGGGVVFTLVGHRFHYIRVAQTKASRPVGHPGPVVSLFGLRRVSAHPWLRKNQGRHRLPAILPGRARRGLPGQGRPQAVAKRSIDP